MSAVATVDTLAASRNTASPTADHIPPRAPPATFVLKQPPNKLPSHAQISAMRREVEVARKLSSSRWPTVAAAAGAVKARLCPNGWGDRVLSMLAFATLGPLRGGSRLLLYWPENERLGAAFSAVNRYARVAHHFVLAPNVSCTTNWTAFIQSRGYWLEHDGPLSQDLLPRQISQRFNMPLAAVTRAYAHAQRTLLKPSAAIEAVLAQQLPTSFTGVHLRRGDKMGVGLLGFETSDRYALTPAHWHELSERTWQALPAAGPVLLCSDDDHERRTLASRLGPRRVLELRSSHYTDVSDTTFLDFFALSRADTVVLSQRWSAFSFTACLVRSDGRPCNYHIAFPHPAQLQAAHRAGVDAIIHPRLLHIIGCHADRKGSRLALPPRWLAGFQASGAILTNACEGVQWPGRPPTDYDPHPTLAKPKAVLQLVQRLVAEGDEEAVIFFAEDDVIVNFDQPAQLSSQTILGRYDAVRGATSIVFGVEPFCWLSRACTGGEIARLYPSATSGYSRCPAFINVGLYIGTARPLLELLTAWVGRTEPGDQERLVKVLHSGSYSVQLDRAEALFATAMSATQQARGKSKHLHECSPCAGNTSCRCDTTIEHAWERAGGGPHGSFRRLAPYRAECGTGGRLDGPLLIHGNGPSEAMLTELLRLQKSAAGHPPPPAPDLLHAPSAPIRVLVIAKSCFAHARLWDGFKRVWGARLAFLYAGDPSQAKLYHLHEQLLSIRTGDGYDNLPSKFVLALAFFARTYSGSHLMHVDDDARLAGPFTPQLHSIDYGGPRLQGAHRRGANRTSHWDRVPPDSFWYKRLAPAHNAVGHTFAHGGSGLYLSVEAMETVLRRWNETNTEELYRSEIFDDVMVSDVLARHGVYAKHIARSGVVGDKPEQTDQCRGKGRTCENYAAPEQAPPPAMSVSQGG